ncbi:unnamed protein product [Orchesella dallaii]|uniref:Enzymatic polyprotein n=1 Tax=Orchesella dallaii TaxID=48710 RepID=A0ABP1PMI5_9HEXA
MEDLRTVVRLMRPNCYMATIDLKDAYYTVPIKDKSKKFLRFIWNETIYEFQCLPFGICTAPRVFTKLMRPVLSYLRKLGVICVIYIDDIWIMGHSIQECTKHVQLTVETLERLGFVINSVKSNLVPSHIVRYLGFVLDSSTMTIKLPSDKARKLQEMCSSIIKVPKMQIQTLSEFLGTVISVCPAVPYGILHTKLLEREKFLALKKYEGNYSGKLTLPSECLLEIQWWKQQVHNAEKAISRDSFDLTIFSDASTTGWGASSNSVSTGGAWTNEESKHHINYLELLAAYHGLRTFARGRNSNILLRIDNATAIAYINKMGGIQYSHLLQITRKIWLYCEERNIHIKASYIPSKANITADAESRKEHDTEWSLSTSVFDDILSRFGPLDIDLFASRLNAKCSTFVSWKPDPFACCIDAFSICWSGKRFYAFPPFNLLPRVLQKIDHDNASGVVVAPYWDSQPWFPQFLSMCIGSPIVIEPNPNLLSSGNRRHPLQKSLRLMYGFFAREAFKLKGSSEASIELLFKSLVSNTWRQYSLHLRKWIIFMTRQQGSPLVASTQDISSFLTELFESGASYTTINSARAALSLVLPDLNGHSVGTHPIITRLLKGIFSSRPPKPRYDTTWDPLLVLNYISTLGSNDKLTLQQLTYKCVMLLALSTAHRVQTLSLLKRTNVKIFSDYIEILVPDRIKTSGLNKVQPCLVIPKFDQTPTLCVMSCLLHYIEQTESLKYKNTDSVFVGICKPHKEVCSQTISRWLKSVMKSSGVDVTVFKGHSTRHAATSAAYRAGTSIDTIRSRAGWSEKSNVFATFYNRFISVFSFNFWCINKHFTLRSYLTRIMLQLFWHL